MKRPLQLPLAIALALGGTDAFALGLGTIHVNSKLNQPLDAEIPVLQGTQGEAEGLLVQLAAAEDFDRVGLNRSRLNVPLEFALSKNSRGEMIIKVTSKEVVREPFIDFLVEANWPKGRLLREYTVLLDPPVMAPAAGSPVTTAARTPERAPATPLPESKPKAAPPRPKSAPVAVAPAAPSEAKPAAAPKRAAGSNEYTVEAGDTLSGIARSARPDESTNVNQMMLALLKQNPNAFFKDNINALKRGAILRIPSADEVKATGSASEAAAQVQSQIEDWRGGAAAKPTLIADTGAKPETKPAPSTTKTPPASTTTASTKPKATPSERLELVPPKAGKDSVAMADRPGSGAGSAASNELKSELARTKEALTSKEQETGELKSRVKELEDTKGKTDRLLSLKDSEIADLQRKLKDMQEAKPGAKTTATTPPSTSTTPTPATTAATTPAATATTPPKPGDKLSKEDIWGNAGAKPSDKTAGTTTPTTTPGSTTPATSSTTPPPTASTTTPSSTTTPAATPGSTTPTPSTSTPSSSTPPSTTGASTVASTATPSSAIPSTTSTPSTTPESSTTDTTTTPAPTPAVTTPPKPSATTTPLKTDAKLKAQPLPKSSPAFYEESWFKPAAIGGAALLVLLALLGLRNKRKATPAVERGSIAGAFGDSPLKPSSDEAFAIPTDGEEQSLRDHLLGDPGNLGLHLELLSLLYAERKVTEFEDAADAMHAYVTDQHQPEWLEAKAMGQELAPHNPLFADGAHAHDDYATAESAFDEAVTAPHATMPSAFTTLDDDVFTEHRREPFLAEPGAPSPASVNEPFDFDLGPTPTPTPPPAAAASEPAFAFDDLPPLNFNQEARHEIADVPAPAPLTVDEDEFPGEDGVSTKLDLAKAYLDMGDPEGARSMLEEVLAEGNDTQKGEARRLMADIR